MAVCGSRQSWALSVAVRSTHGLTKLSQGEIDGLRRPDYRLRASGHYALSAWDPPFGDRRRSRAAVRCPARVQWRILGLTGGELAIKPFARFTPFSSSLAQPRAQDLGRDALWDVDAQLRQRSGGARRLRSPDECLGSQAPSQQRQATSVCGRRLRYRRCADFLRTFKPWMHSPLPAGKRILRLQNGYLVGIGSANSGR
jgi:hypothetical protein